MSGDTTAFDRFDPEDGAWIQRPGLRLVTRGTRRTILVPPGAERMERLADAVRTSLAPGEIAVGAISFDRRAQAVLSVPEEFSLDESPEPLPHPDETTPRTLRLEAFPTPERYEDSVAKALESIAAGRFEKVVLARMLIAHGVTPFDRKRLLAVLAEREPAARLFAVEGFVGATPELVVARQGRLFRSEPLAGTRALGVDPEAAAEELSGSDKDRREHALVADTVRAALEPFAAELDVSPPSVVRTASLAHLATRIEGRLLEDSVSVLDLLAAVHPTPAIAGLPREAALEAISELEGFDRTRYGGAVGWVDSNGDGEWGLTLRCAEVRGRIAILFAGAGIVAGSDPHAERLETDAKFAPMLRALERC